MFLFMMYEYDYLLCVEVIGSIEEQYYPKNFWPLMAKRRKFSAAERYDRAAPAPSRAFTFVLRKRVTRVRLQSPRQSCCGRVYL